MVLLDYPSHRNIGDHLIWLGETAYLGGRKDISVHWLSDRFSYSHRSLGRRLPAGAVVLLHGGGNFGDLYPQVQRSRESIVEQFRQYRFIQLPQTISFEPGASVCATAAVLERHPDFTLLARDEQSFEFAREALPCRVELCVDAAFMLGPQSRSAAVDRDIRWIARRDEESVHSPVDLPANVEVFDWTDVDFDSRAWALSHRGRRIWAGVLAGLRAQGVPLGPLGSRLVHALDKSSAAHAKAGFHHLSQAEILVTDRLHGHIMAVLLDMPHVVLDSADSKVKNFYETWTCPAACANWADTPEQALELAQSLLAKRASA